MGRTTNVSNYQGHDASRVKRVHVMQARRTRQQRERTSSPGISVHNSQSTGSWHKPGRQNERGPKHPNQQQQRDQALKREEIPLATAVNHQPPGELQDSRQSATGLTGQVYVAGFGCRRLPWGLLQRSWRTWLMTENTRTQLVDQRRYASVSSICLIDPGTGTEYSAPYRNIFKYRSV